MLSQISSFLMQYSIGCKRDFDFANLGKNKVFYVTTQCKKLTSHYFYTLVLVWGSLRTEESQFIISKEKPLLNNVSQWIFSGCFLNVSPLSHTFIWVSNRDLVHIQNDSLLFIFLSLRLWRICLVKLKMLV